MVKLSYDGLKKLMDIHQVSQPVDWNQFFLTEKPLDVEIGFGLGEFLMEKARRYPDRNFVGIEQNWERIRKVLKKISPFENIQILKLDAHVAFERLFSCQSVNNIDCLFPCPWPKERHEKHRLFSHKFFCLLNSRLRSQGQVQIVTDHFPYFEWMLEEVKGAGFRIQTDTIGAQFNTKFERKWTSMGQKEFFKVSLEKSEHKEIPLPEPFMIKSYLVKDFHPERFVFDDLKGKSLSVIFKEILFDREKQKALIHFVVSEPHLTQNFRVMIVKESQEWQIGKADGQSFFPTPGIARAVDLVYQAVNCH